MPQAWMSAEEIAAHLGVTKDTSWVTDRARPAHKVGWLRAIQAAQVNEWVPGGGASTSTKGVTK